MISKSVAEEINRELALWLEAYVNFTGVPGSEELKNLEKIGPRVLLQLVRLGSKNHLLLEYMAKFGKKYAPHLRSIKLQDVKEAIDVVKTKMVINS